MVCLLTTYWLILMLSWNTQILSAEFGAKCTNYVIVKDWEDISCDLTYVKTTWSTNIPNTVEKDNKLIIESYSIPTTTGGEYFFNATVYFKDVNGETVTKLAPCSAKIPSERLAIVLQGGYHRYVRADESFMVDATGCVDFDVPINERTENYLEYRWSCKSNPETNFCNNLPVIGQTVVFVPEDVVKPDTTFNFQFSVKSKRSDWKATSQLITAVDDAIELVLTCEENCLPLTPIAYVNSPIIFNVSCYNEMRCANVDTKTGFLWTVTAADDSKFDYEQMAVLGRNSNKFMIKPGSLQSNVEYNVEVRIADNPFSLTSTTLEADTLPVIEKCSVEPPKGYAVQTKFKVKCVLAYPDVFQYEVFNWNTDKVALMGSGSSLDQIEFVLPVNSLLLVRIADEFNHYATTSIPVQIDALSSAALKEGQKTVIQMLIHIVDDPTMMGNAASDPAKIIQLLSAILAELKSIKLDDPETISLRDELRAKLLDKLNVLPLDEPNILDAIAFYASTISNLREPDQDSDPYVASAAARVCKKAAKEMARVSRTTRVVHVKQIIEALFLCTENDVVPNYESIRPKNSTIATTEYPFISVDAIKEDYPNYIDDDEALDHAKNYAAASKGTIEICHSTTNALSRSLTSTDEITSIQTKFWFASSVRVEAPEMFITAHLSSHGIRIVPLEQPNAAANIYNILFCTTTNNPFWWKESVRETFSAYGILKVMDDDEVPIVGSFHVYITLLNTSRDIVDYHRISRIFPVKGSNDWQEYDILYIKIAAGHNRNFVIEIKDVKGNEEFLVAFGNFSKPTVQDIQQNGEKITTENGTITYYKQHPHNYDAWHYLAILPPNEKAQKGSTVNFTLSIYTPACISWNMEEANDWGFLCKVLNTTELERIHCECTYPTIVTGYVYNNDIKVEDKLLLFKFELTLQFSWYILIVTLGIFAIYCILIILVARKPKGHPIYVVSDLKASAEIPYLLIVKTGWRPSSGTTSNIGIRLYGDLAISSRHVLNYPDPYLKMLQRGHSDWYVLTTEQRLGNILEIELWFDCVGNSPSWFCKEITIYEMTPDRNTLDNTEKKSWYFRVEKWLKIYPKDLSCIRVSYIGDLMQDTHLTNSEKKKVHHKWLQGRAKKKITDGNDDEKMESQYQHDRDFLDSFCLITYRLSIIYTIMSLNLITFGMPSFRLNDGFSYYDHIGFFRATVFLTFTNLIVTYVSHTIWIYVFRITDEASNNDLKRNRILLLRKLCWITLISNVMLHLTVLIIFGLWLPFIMTCICLIHSLLAILIYFSFVQILETYIKKCYFKIVIKQVVKEVKYQRDVVQNRINWILTHLTEQKRIMLENLGEFSLRPYLKHLHRTLDYYEVKVKQNHWLVRHHIWDIIKDALMFSVYIILLYTTVLYNRDSHGALANTVMEHYVRGIHSDQLSKSISLRAVMHYINETLIPLLHSYHWYGSFYVNVPGLMGDFNSKYLGVARLRQHRTISESCQVLHPLQFLTTTCKYAYGSSTARTNDIYAEDTELDLDRMGNVWAYQSSNATGTGTTFGEIGTYSSGGFVAFLGRNLYNSYVNFEYLSRKGWFAYNETSSVFVYFLVYNVNSNIFHSVDILWEVSTAGIVHVNLSTRTMRLIFARNEAKFMVISLIICSVINMIIISVNGIMKFRRYGRKFMFDFWNFIDALMIMLGVVAVIMYSIQHKQLGKFMKKVKLAKHNEFVPFKHLLYFTTVNNFLAAILIVMSTVRLWKCLRFRENFRIMERTLVICLMPICDLLLCYFPVIVMFSMCAKILYGTMSIYFSNIVDTASTLVLLSFSFEPSSLKMLEYLKQIGMVGYIFHVMFLVVEMLLTNITSCMILLSYERAKDHFSTRQPQYKIGKYLMERLRYYKLLTVLRLKGGNSTSTSDRHHTVEPKREHYRYKHLVHLPGHRLYLLRNRTLCYLCDCLRDQKKYVELKYRAMLKILYNYCGGVTRQDDPLMCFVSSAKTGERHKLVTNDRFLEMEHFLNTAFKRHAAERNAKIKAIYDQNEQRLDSILDTVKNIEMVFNNIEFKR